MSQVYNATYSSDEINENIVNNIEISTISNNRDILDDSLIDISNFTDFYSASSDGEYTFLNGRKSTNLNFDDKSYLKIHFLKNKINTEKIIKKAKETIHKVIQTSRIKLLSDKYWIKYASSKDNKLDTEPSIHELTKLMNQVQFGLARKLSTLFENSSEELIGKNNSITNSDNQKNEKVVMQKRTSSTNINRLRSIVKTAKIISNSSLSCSTSEEHMIEDSLHETKLLLTDENEKFILTREDLIINKLDEKVNCVKCILVSPSDRKILNLEGNSETRRLYCNKSSQVEDWYCGDVPYDVQPSEILELLCILHLGEKNKKISGSKRAAISHLYRLGVGQDLFGLGNYVEEQTENRKVNMKQVKNKPCSQTEGISSDCSSNSEYSKSSKNELQDRSCSDSVLTYNTTNSQYSESSLLQDQNDLENRLSFNYDCSSTELNKEIKSKWKHPLNNRVKKYKTRSSNCEETDLKKICSNDPIKFNKYRRLCNKFEKFKVHQSNSDIKSDNESCDWSTEN